MELLQLYKGYNQVVRSRRPIRNKDNCRISFQSQLRAAKWALILLSARFRSSTISINMDRDTGEWLSFCKKVLEAGENYGCFEVVNHKISPELQAETFSIAKELFNLPYETKVKNVNPKPFHEYYMNKAVAPLYEGFGMEDASNLESVKNFMELMWSDHGNDAFSQTIHSMVKKMEEVNRVIEMLIIDSYGLREELVDSIVPCKTLLRLMKYEAPPSGEYKSALVAHSDKPMSALLRANQVSGLEIETKDGQWIRLSPSRNSFIYVIGDPLMAWSNGRLHAARHRVMMEGHEERYSLAAFPIPVEGTIIKPSNVLIDDQHPQILKDFDFMDFCNFSISKEGMAIESSKQIFAFAGI